MKRGNITDALAGALVIEAGASGTDAASTGSECAATTSSAIDTALGFAALSLAMASSAPLLLLRALRGRHIFGGLSLLGEVALSRRGGWWNLSH